MLSRLEIENYGLIAAAAVEFAPGATIFTGETGSGKTMLLGALDFALGARAGADVVGRAARRAVVSITFDPDETLRARLEADGFALDPGEEASIAREVTDAGRSSVRVNGRSSTAGYVREIGMAIAEIVGQHEAQRLLAPAYHLELLDRFAGEPALSLREAAGAAYAGAQAAAAEYERLRSDERDARGRYDEALFIAREIEEARLDAGEIARLRERRAFLDNVERIATALAGAREGLASDYGGAAPALGVAAAALAGVGAFGEELREMAQRAAALQSDAGELAGDVARALEAAEYDPAELESTNARLAAVERLQRRYGAEIEDILERAVHARRTIDEFENHDARLARARLQTGAANAELERVAALLSKARRKAAATLGKRVLAELGGIALGSGRFEVAVDPLERAGAFGADRVEFLFAANAGESARPIARVASGGELSRVLLALVVALAQARDVREALIFDEIDAGIGGATATAVGERLAKLADSGQVICVTHLAQIATAAQRHYVLEKSERKGETTICVRELSGPKEREAEIARMLSGETHDVALRHARALLVRARG
ncbi:MAG TPA: DNA repair protein RecN [Candidatus Cybelea sp.]|jgi:DNA repair protein RecN (Recombination protein N)|nr:DNA repair protein RecN [Candidatus Cybelea sp.]